MISHKMAAIERHARFNNIINRNINRSTYFISDNNKNGSDRFLNILYQLIFCFQKQRQKNDNDDEASSS